MSDNAVNKSINLPLAEEEESVQENTFPLAIKELGEALFEDYEDKTSNLSEENILGTIRCDAINEYMEITYGYRYASLDVIVQKKMARNLSNNGFGIDRLIEIVKSVQASFQAVEQPSMGQQLMGRGGR
jgi:hypothetical protein